MRRGPATWLLVAAGLVGCTEQHVCDSDPAGWYAIDFNAAVLACTETEFDNQPDELLVTDGDPQHGFSSDGCDVTLSGRACYGGPGLWCGELRWVEAGVYEGELTYASQHPSGGWADCLIRSEEAVLTLTRRYSDEHDRDR